MAKLCQLTMLFICVSGIYNVAGRRKRAKEGLKFTDCGMDPDRPLSFFEFRASPVPIVAPGTLYVSFRGNLTDDLPRTLSIELRVVKYFIGIPFPLPCFDGTLGSCLYENICDNLERFEVLGCPKTLKQYGLQCHCPFKSGEFQVRNLPLNIPKIRGFARAFIRVRVSQVILFKPPSHSRLDKGDYGLTLRVLDYEDSYRELGCLQLNFAMKKRYKGWLFKI